MPAPASPPNIVFILADQLRKQAVGAYGGDLAHTPNLDALSAEGCVFDHAYTTCAVCTPARASLQTGYYPFRHGMQTNLFMNGCMVHELADSPGLLSRRLEASGYHPALTGKWHLGFGREAFEDPVYMENFRAFDGHLEDIEYPAYYRAGSGMPTKLGYHGDDFPGHGGGGHAYPQYQEYLKRNGLEHDLRVDGPGMGEVLSGEDSTMDYFLTSRAIELSEAGRQSGRPWFTMLNYWGPHEPEYVPTRFLDLYRDRALPPWPSFEADLAAKPRFHDATRDPGQPWSHFEQRLRYSLAYMAFLDDQIGRVIHHLKDTGEYDETLIIFASDHGDSMGIHGGLNNKAIFMYEDTVSVPLMIKPPKSWSGQPAGGMHLDPFVNLTDLYATIVEASGQPRAVAEERHGRSLVPVLWGEEVSDWPDCVVTEGSGIAGLLVSQRMLRHGDIKYVFNAGDREELYDLAQDPHELRNLAAEPGHADLLGQMRGRLDVWMEERGDFLRSGFRNILGL
ncbi:MAG: sulfatase-like hydrolase/transferase [Verrucomicrobiota bacterium]